MTAILIEPSADGPHPGLLFLHPAGGSKNNFLSEGKDLSAVGFVCLLIDAPFKRPQSDRVIADIQDPRSVYANYMQCVGDVRRGFDVLGQLASVDSGRLAYVGKNYGATLAAAISVVEPRARAIVAIAGLPRQSVFWQTAEHPAAQERRAVLGDQGVTAYVNAIVELDMIALMPETRARHWLFQFGRRDDWIPKAEIVALRSVLPHHAHVVCYDDGHAMESPEAKMDRQRWLEKSLYDR